jgi:hypothetical protein
MALYAALELWLTRGTTVFIDEISMFIQDRGLHPSNLLAPFNEHLELTRRAMYAVALKLFGASATFVVARLVELAGVILLSALVFVFIKRRVGAAAALAPTVLLLVFGSAWELNFAISGIGNVYALAAGTGALMMLARRTRRADAVACVLLTASVVSFTVGVAFVAGALCLLLLEPGSSRRIWVVLVPLAVYAAWLVWVRAVYVPAHGEVQHIALTNVLLIPNIIAQEAASTAGALAGLNYDFQANSFFAVFSTSSGYGALLAVLATGALVWRLRRAARPMLWALIVTLVAYWVELAVGIGTGRNPTTVRYVYAGAVIAMLIAAEAGQGLLRSRGSVLILYGVSALGLLGNAARLREGMNFYRAFGTVARAQLTAIELARPSVDPNFSTNLASLAPISAGPYLEAVRRNGSPAYSQAELLDQSESLRSSADLVLVAALRLGTAPHPTGEAVTGCQRRVGAPGSPASIVVGPPGISLSTIAGGQLAVSRYASRSTVALGNLPSRTTMDLRIPHDRSGRPWHVTITPLGPQTTVCSLSAGG